MKAWKHALFITREGLASHALAEDLGQLVGFAATNVGSAQEALECLQEVSHFSMVVIDQTLAEGESQRLVESIKGLHKRLPIVWLSENNEPDKFGKYSPDVFLASDVIGPVFLVKTQDVVNVNAYPDKLVQVLTSAPNAIISQTLQTPVLSTEACLKYSESLHGDLCAMISFFSNRSYGMVVLNGRLDELAEICVDNELLDEQPDRYDVCDVAGEIVNQIIGIIGRDLEDIVGKTDVNIPTSFFGENISMAYNHRDPTLSVRVDHQYGTLWIDFVFLSLQITDQELEGKFLDSGEIEFF